MADNQNEEADREALNGLSDKDRKETEEILGTIDAEAGKKEGEEPDAKDAEAAKLAEDERRAALTDEERVAEDAAKALVDGKVEVKKPDEIVKPESRRNAPKLMPVYVHKVAENKWQQDREKLLSSIEDLTKTNSSKEGETQEAKDARLAKIKAVADKHGYEPAFVEDILAIATENGGKLPPEVEQGLRKAHGLSAERDLEMETANYSADFDRVILPIIKAEYGDDVPKNVISDIKEDLKGLAYSEEYAKVPYEVIYRGNAEFRGLVPAKQKGGESSRGGSNVESDATGKPDLTKPISDTQLKTLSDADFDTYAKNMEVYEKAQKQK